MFGSVTKGASETDLEFYSEENGRSRTTLLETVQCKKHSYVLEKMIGIFFHLV